MEMKHVVLRRRARAARPGTFSFGGPGATAAEAHAGTPATDHSIEVAQIGIKEAKSMSRDPDVAAIAPAMPMKLIEPFAVAAATDPLTGGVTWGIRAVGADTSPFDGEGIVVAVLDTGIDPTHPAFTGVELVRKNFTTGPDDDQHGHGTHCAGTILPRRQRHSNRSRAWSEARADR